MLFASHMPSRLPAGLMNPPGALAPGVRFGAETTSDVPAEKKDAPSASQDTLALTPPSVKADSKQVLPEAKAPEIKDIIAKDLPGSQPSTASVGNLEPKPEAPVTPEGKPKRLPNGLVFLEPSKSPPSQTGSCQCPPPKEITETSRGLLSYAMARVLRACGDSAYQQYFDLPRDYVSLSHQILEGGIREAVREMKPASHFLGSMSAWGKVKSKTFTSAEFYKMLPNQSPYAIETELRFLFNQHFVGYVEEGEGSQAVGKYYLTSKALRTMGFDPYSLKTDYKGIALDAAPKLELDVLKELKRMADEQFGDDEAMKVRNHCIEKGYIEGSTLPRVMYSVEERLQRNMRKQREGNGSEGDALSPSLTPVKLALDSLWQKGYIAPMLSETVPDYLVKESGIEEPEQLFRSYLLKPASERVTGIFSIDSVAIGWIFTEKGMALLESEGAQT